MMLDDRPGTRIKLCGMTREADVDAAVALDIDAIGLVFYRPSARFVDLDTAARLAARVPPSIDVVGLFVDASAADVDAASARVPLTLLQFHGDEPPADCGRFGLPWLKAARVVPGLDLLDFASAYDGAGALLLDTHSAGYGGSGKVFDWSLVPSRLIGPGAARRVVLSGGLSAANVADAVHRLHPFAVDTSSGIESAKGIKDAVAMRDFVAAVRATDRSPE